MFNHASSHHFFVNLVCSPRRLGTRKDARFAQHLSRIGSDDRDIALAELSHLKDFKLVGAPSDMVIHSFEDEVKQDSLLANIPRPILPDNLTEAIDWHGYKLVSANASRADCAPFEQYNSALHSYRLSLVIDNNNTESDVGDCGDRLQATRRQVRESDAALSSPNRKRPTPRSESSDESPAKKKATGTRQSQRSSQLTSTKHCSEAIREPSLNPYSFRWLCHFLFFRAWCDR